MEERIDNIGFGDLKLIQMPEEFCYGVDAVMLSDFAAKMCTQKGGAKAICDLGTGTGVVPFILSYKTEAQRIYGIEVQKDSFDRAVRGAQLNGLEDRVKFINMDVKDISDLGKDYLETFDMVTSNPPYTKAQGGILSSSDAKAIARHETTATVEDFIETAAKLLKDRGDFVLVHRPGRIADICCALRDNKLEPKEIQLVSPREGETPNIMMIHAVKNGGKFLKFLKPINVYDGEDYSEEIRKMY